MDPGAELDNFIEQVARLRELQERHAVVRKHNPHSDLSDMERTIKSAGARIDREIDRIRTARRYATKLFDEPPEESDDRT
jgi:hypothetical protein